MSANQSKALLLLKSQVKNALELFAETQPDVTDWLKQQDISLSSIRNDQAKSVGQKISGKINRFNSPDAINISMDEQKTILDKIREISQMPPGQLQNTEALYLEQQLSDLIGIEVVSKLENHVLPHNHGVIASGKHTKRYAGDQLEAHKNVLEAGIATSRTDFGWLKSGLDSKSNSIFEENEMYSITVQLQNLETWQTQRKELVDWYKSRKVIVINPFNNKAVLGVIAGTGPSSSSRRQFSGSPELIRDLEAWSLEAQGRVLVLFVNNDSDRFELGPISLTQVGGK